MSRFLVLTMLIASLGCSGAGDEEKMNLLFVTFDTTRADALSIYGNDKIRLPAIESLAAEGVVFERAYSSAPITLPSHSTMMTGRHPYNHGARDNGLFILDEAQTTLAEVLRDAGWSTGAAIGAFPLTSEFGIDQGFEFYDDVVETIVLEGKRGLFFDERSAGRVNNAVLGWLRESSDDPFFLWVHYFDAHKPMDPKPPFDQLYDDPYLGEIAYADDNLGFLLAELDRLGVADNTVVVMVADHGEGRGQHREDTHSMLIYDATIHVPMVIKVPGGAAGRRVKTPVGLVDLFPTLLDVLGLESPVEVDGRSLASVFQPENPDPPRRPLYAETISPRLTFGWGELRSLRHEGEKYIHGPRPELFAVDEDPGELHDLTQDHPERAAQMRQQLATFLESTARDVASEQQDIDEETIAKLEALGYLHGGGDDSAIEERLRDEGVPPQDKVNLVSKFSRTKEYLWGEEYRVARALAAELVEEDPTNPSYVQILATIEVRLGLHDPAVDRLVGLLGTDPSTTARALMIETLAATTLSTGRAARMIGAVENSEALEPTAAGQRLLARCLFELGSQDDGEQALMRSLVIDPKDVETRIDLAVFMLAFGREAEGIAALDQIVTDSPFNVRALKTLGIAQQRQGQPVAAAAVLERAAGLQPEDQVLLRALLQTYVSLDREADARELLEQLRQIDRAAGSDLEKLVEDRWPSD